jgi:hypothetical protein
MEVRDETTGEHMSQLEEVVRELEFLLTGGVGDHNITYIMDLVQKHVVTGHPVIVGVAENFGITAQPQQFVATA